MAINPWIYYSSTRGYCTDSPTTTAYWENIKSLGSWVTAARAISIFRLSIKCRQRFFLSLSLSLIQLGRSTKKKKILSKRFQR